MKFDKAQQKVQFYKRRECYPIKIKKIITSLLNVLTPICQNNFYTIFKIRKKNPFIYEGVYR